MRFKTVLLTILFTIAVPVAMAEDTRKQIRTYMDFEKSFLYNELHFKNLKNPDGYRLYKDENNNYIVALQVDSRGNILRERILPMQKVGSKSQNSGLFFFVIDFICGDGAALRDIKATERMKPYIANMFTEEGAQVDTYKVSLAYDPWKIRSGLDIRTTGARPWDLAFPAKPETSSRLNQTDGNATAAADNARLNAELTNLKLELEHSKELEKSLEQQLQAVNSQRLKVTNELQTTTSELLQARSQLQSNKVESEIARDKLARDYNTKMREVTVERDIAVGKMSDLEALCSAYQARMRREPSIVSDAPITDSLFDKPKSALDDKSLNWSGAKSYKKEVEEKIWRSLRQLTPVAHPKCAKAQLTFDIQSDGSPANVSVIVSEPRQSIAETDLIAQNAQNILLAAAPFHSLHLLPFNKLKMVVEIEQEPDRGSINYSVSSHFSESSQSIPTVSATENRR